jgi:hypothetical protein
MGPPEEPDISNIEGRFTSKEPKQGRFTSCRGIAQTTDLLLFRKTPRKSGGYRAPE